MTKFLDCPLPILTNGILINSESKEFNFYKSVVQYNCTNAPQLASKATCLEGGIWSSPPPNCDRMNSDQNYQLTMHFSYAMYFPKYHKRRNYRHFCKLCNK